MPTLEHRIARHQDNISILVTSYDFPTVMPNPGTCNSASVAVYCDFHGQLTPIPGPNAELRFVLHPLFNARSCSADGRAPWTGVPESPSYVPSDRPNPLPPRPAPNAHPK